MYRDSNLLKLLVKFLLQNFIVRLLLHRDDGFVPLRIERVSSVILQFDLRTIIEVQDGFVCVADLEILPVGAFLFLRSLFFHSLFTNQERRGVPATCPC